jgi:hypothetical protein
MVLAFMGRSGGGNALRGGQTLFQSIPYVTDGPSLRPYKDRPSRIHLPDPQRARNYLILGIGTRVVLCRIWDWWTPDCPY